MLRKCFLLVFVSTQLHAQTSDTSRLSLLFLGDIMQHDSQMAAAYSPLLGEHDYSDCFAPIRPVLASADLTIGNLELTLAGRPYKGYPQFSAPEQLATALKNAGIDVLVTANNHSVDRGRTGIERTIRVLDSLHIPHTGTFVDSVARASTYPMMIEKNGIRLALLNYTFSTNGIPVPRPTIVNRIDTVQIKKDLIAARTASPDAIVVFFHWGVEYQSLPHETQKKLTEFCFRQGITLVIGAHPHVVQPIVWKQDSHQLVAYSLGNFVSGQRDRYKNGGVMLRVDLATVQRDSLRQTIIEGAEYELQYVYRNTQKKYFILPARLFGGDSLVVREGKERQQLTEFLNDSRALFDRHNQGVTQSNRTYADDSLHFALVADSIPEGAGSFVQFYSATRDSINRTWLIGEFYEWNLLVSALRQWKAQWPDRSVRVAVFRFGRRED